MSPHMQDSMKTPFFMFNSKYDAWQLEHEAQLPCFRTDRVPKNATCTQQEQADVMQYGDDFLAALTPDLSSEPRNGAFITSCICHSCPWDVLALVNKTSYEHYAAWHQGKTSGAAAITIDPGPPNGGGTLFPHFCLSFP